MGCGTSSDKQEAIEISKQIEALIEKDRVAAKREIKILLLGAGESGKSTIFKQLRIIHDSGYNVEERKQYKPIIYSNTIHSLFAILQAMAKLNIELSSSSSHDDANEFLSRIIGNFTEVTISSRLGEVMQSLWNDEGVQLCFLRAREYHLNDAAGYYLRNLDRISHPEYVPNQRDVLQSRVRTIGMVQTKFYCKTKLFKVFDLGGHRSERKSWFHYFEAVNAIIFCNALSAYDLALEEDEEVNRLHESLKLFKSICNNKWFVSTSIVLFLNKTDIFEKKIKLTPLTVCFPEYDGLNTNEDSIAYIKMKFEDMAKERPRKDMYTHLTCAIDTRNIQWVFDGVSDVIIQSNHKDCRFV